MLHILPFACLNAGPGGGVPGGAPEILTAVVSEFAAQACGVPWEVEVAWTLDFYNDTDYEIEIAGEVSSLVPSDMSYVITRPSDTGGAGTGNVHNAQYTVRLVRKSDMAVVDSMATNLLQVETGADC